MSINQATPLPKRVRVDGVPNLYQRPADGRYEVGYTGSDGKWHDAFLPASFTVKAGAKVVVSVVNYDDMAHSFHSKGLKTNAIIMPGTDKGKLTKFTFVAPKKAGRYAWHCDPKCDPWAMKHVGFMKGFVTVVH